METRDISHTQADMTNWQQRHGIPPWVSGKEPHGQQSGPVDGRGYWLKRPFDICVALVGLVIALPLWIIFSIAIKLEDGGPIFFLQDRRGKNKGIIRIFKFRTMVPNAIEKFGNVQAQENDPRITKTGRFLRATSLDEMPQLLNILNGDMSWVGPRALPLDEVQVHEDQDLPDESIPGFDERTKLRPGLTGIAQIFAPRDVPRQEKYRYDAIYGQRQSLWLDLRLIFASVLITLRARWESRESKL